MAGGVAALVLAMSACSGNGSSSANNGFTDSLATYLGKVEGAQYAQRVQGLPEADAKKFNKESFLRGLKHVLDADTADFAYYVGLSVGLGEANQLNSMSQNGIDVDRAKVYSEFAKAFKQDSINETALQEESMTFQRLFQQAQTIMMQKQQERMQAAREEESKKAQAAKDAGTKYVEDAKKADASIKTTESGLSYKVVKEGKGAKPVNGDRVKVKYTGKLPDGTVFDSNDNAEFSVNGVIPGFAEGLKMMTPGSEYVLYIPSSIGYGDQGTPDGSIPGGSTLTFEVELLEVMPSK